MMTLLPINMLYSVSLLYLSGTIAVKFSRDDHFICQDEYGSRTNFSLLELDRCDGKRACTDTTDENCGKSLERSTASRLFIAHGLYSETLFRITQEDSSNWLPEKTHSSSLMNPMSWFGGGENTNSSLEIPLLDKNVVILEEEYCKSSNKVEFLYQNTSHIYFMCKFTNGINVVQIENGQATSFIIPGATESLKLDPVTNNLYILENSTIKLCNWKETTCSKLNNIKVEGRVTELAFSSKYGYLFFIDERSSKSSIKRCERDGSSCIDIRFMIISTDDILHDNLASMTIDEPMDRLYWMQNTQIFSSTFNGTEEQNVNLPDNSVEVFTVSANHLYWSEYNKTRNNRIHECNATNCTQKMRTQCCLTNITALNYLVPSDQPELKKNPCDAAVCSHLCTFISKEQPVCYCEDDDNGFYLKRNNSTNYCEGTTLLIAYGPDLYIIGLNLSNSTPIIRKTSFDNFIISSVTYDSVKGNVILANTVKACIYSWNPLQNNNTLTTISCENDGIIKSLEFDKTNNTIFWVNPRFYSVGKMDRTSSKMTTVFKGNETYIPQRLTLVPGGRSMYVLFSNTNGCNTIVEYISMDGVSKNRSWCVNENNGFDDLSLHYNRYDNKVYLSNKRNRVIECLNKDTREFEYVADSVEENISSITSLRGKLIWIEGSSRSSVIQLANNIATVYMNMSLDLNSKKYILEMKGVPKPEHFRAPDRNRQHTEPETTSMGKYGISRVYPSQHVIPTTSVVRSVDRQGTVSSVSPETTTSSKMNTPERDYNPTIGIEQATTAVISDSSSVSSPSLPTSSTIAVFVKEPQHISSTRGDFMQASVIKNDISLSSESRQSVSEPARSVITKAVQKVVSTENLQIAQLAPNLDISGHEMKNDYLVMFLTVVGFIAISVGFMVAVRGFVRILGFGVEYYFAPKNKLRKEQNLYMEMKSEKDKLKSVSSTDNGELTEWLIIDFVEDQ